MILTIKLSQCSDLDVEYVQECIIPGDELLEPYDLTKCFPQKERHLIKGYTVQLVIDDEQDILIVNDGKTSTEIPVLGEGEVYSEDLDKDDWTLSIYVTPRFVSIYDTLTVSNGEENISYTIDDFNEGNKHFVYPNNGKKVPWLESFTVCEFDDKRLWIISAKDKSNIHLDQDKTTADKHGIEFELSSNLVRINEYDPMDEVIRVFHVDGEDFDLSDEDADAAYRMAEQIAEQCPEALEIIADYMEDAAELGSKDALEWLKDYHSDDGRFDAWS